MSLTKSLSASLDRTIESTPRFAAFTKLKSTGSEIRNYFCETDGTQCQLLFFKDKWWTKDGGTLHGELFCLVPKVQLALCGQAQSLAAPDYAVPFHHFQLGLQKVPVESTWPIHSADDVTRFETAVKTWLTAIATPWFAQFDTDAGVMDYMERNGQHFNLALLHAKLGQSDTARAHLVTWLTALPRQIDTPLGKLHEAGLLSTTDQTTLARASLQSEDDYRRMVNTWAASR